MSFPVAFDGSTDADAGDGVCCPRTDTAVTSNRLQMIEARANTIGTRHLCKRAAGRLPAGNRISIGNDVQRYRQRSTAPNSEMSLSFSLLEGLGINASAAT
jgi:hypothetical protein